jgi:hypothetical protein
VATLSWLVVLGKEELLFPGRFFYNSNEAHKHQEGEEHKLEEEDDSRVK